MNRYFKKYLLALNLILLSVIADAATYYLSAAGSDLNNGTSVATPWKSITHLNSQMALLVPGTQVLFRRGDVFTGQIDLTANGTAGAKIVFDAYGTGLNPVIRAGVAASGWVVHNGNIWKTQVTADTVIQLFESKDRLQIARFPDSGFLRVDAAGGVSSFTDAALTQANNYFSGANVVMQTVDWAWEYKQVLSSTSAGVLTFQACSYPPEADMGYFFTNKMDFVTVDGEWYYDPTTKYLYLYSTNDPNTKTYMASVYDYGIKGNWGREYISISNIDFEGQNETAVWLRGASCKFLNIAGCSFINQNKYAVQLMGDSLMVKNCYFQNISGIGLEGSNITKFNFSNNTFSKIGLMPGFGNSGTGDLQGIRIWGGSNGMLKRNQVDSTGYAGITVNADHVLIEENVISNTLLISSDGAGLYSYNSGTHDNIYRRNIVSNVFGNMTARPASAYELVMGIYMDNDVHHVTLSENTVSNIAGEGIRINAGAHDNVIEKNTTYKCNAGICFSDWYAGKSVYNNTMKHNIFYSNKTGAIPVLLQSDDNNYDMVSVSDSNYFCNPYANEVVRYAWSQTQDFTLAQWQSVSGLDAKTKLSFYQWIAPLDSSFLVLNSSAGPLSFNYANTVDLDNNHISALTLQSFSGKILIGGTNVTGNRDFGNEQEPVFFPNPASEGINFRSDKVITQVIIRDISGRELKFVNGQNITFVDVKDLAGGVYFLMLRTNNSDHEFKMIKQL